MNYVKPAIIHSVFLPSLRGSESKMSASDPDSSIFLGDTNNQIKKKIGKAFSGGQDTRELHREIGGRTAVDVPFQYLTFFLEDDDELERIRAAYEKGLMESGDMKGACTRELQAYVSGFRIRRAQVTEQVRADFMTPRQLVFRGMPGVIERTAVKKARIQVLEAELARLREELEAGREGVGVGFPGGV